MNNDKEIQDAAPPDIDNPIYIDDIPHFLREEFNLFIQGENKNAPYNQFKRALGLPDKNEKQRSSEVREKIAKIISQIEVKTQQEPGSLNSYVDIFANELRKDLKPNKDISSSMLDVSTLGLKENVKIFSFLNVHGYPVTDEDDEIRSKAETDLIEIFKESISFFNSEIAENPSENIALEIADIDDVFHIFKVASGSSKKKRIENYQACGVLRIAAVIDFINKDPKLSLLPFVNKSLQDLKSKNFFQKNNNWYFTTGGITIPLAREPETRLKDRKRVLAKLLHKSTNRAEEVSDHIGMRIVAKNALGVLKIIQNMFFNSDPSCPSTNIIINRSKENMFKLTCLENNDCLHDILLEEDEEKAKKLLDEVYEQIRNHQELNSDSLTNPFSSPVYKAIQITLDLPCIAIKIRPDGVVETFSFNFPVEIQILDSESMENNEKEADHNGYVGRQIAAVRRRVKRNNLTTAFKEKQKRIKENGVSMCL
jgi:uncharacterized protein (TIGR04562 family)